MRTPIYIWILPRAILMSVKCISAQSTRKVAPIFIIVTRPNHFIGRIYFHCVRAFKLCIATIKKKNQHFFFVSFIFALKKNLFFYNQSANAKIKAKKRMTEKANDFLLFFYKRSSYIKVQPHHLSSSTGILYTT